MPTNGELPADVDPDELNAMIGDIAHELGCPYDVHPGHVDLDADPEREAGGFNRGCTRDGKPWDGPTIYREGQRWRRRAIAELKRRPEWAQQWLAGAELDREIERLCEAKGLRFEPFECPPWWVRCDEELPDPQDGMWGERARGGGRQVLQPGHGRLRAQVRVGLGQPAEGHLERRVGTQGVAIVGVRVTGRDQEHPESDHLGQRVVDAARSPGVLKAARQALHEAEAALHRWPAPGPRRRRSGDPPSKETWTVLWATGDATDSIKAPSAHRRPKHGSPAAFRSARHGDLG